MAAVWITKETSVPGKLDARGRPSRVNEKVETAGVRGVRQGDVFVVCWVANDGTRRREKIKGCGKPAKELADTRAQEIAAQLTLGTGDAVRARHHRWADVKQRYITDVVSLKRSEETKSDIKKTLARFESIICPRSMADVTTAAVDRFKAARAKLKSKKTGEHLAAPTINKDLRNLKAFCRKAAKWKVLADVPDFEMLDVTESERPTHTVADLRAMLSHCGAATMPSHLPADHREQWWKTLITLLWETGARIGEMMSLEWTRVDFDRFSFTVNPANTKGKRRKLLCFGAEGYEMLQQLAAYGTEGHVFEWRHDKAYRTRQLARIAAAAGVTLEHEQKFHAVRRSVGNYIAATYGLDSACEKLGHSNVQITRIHYAQEARRAKARAAEMPALKVVG